jgi:mannose/fructose/N-acetylgalactosamine-specific phosphotransferase system component IID
MSDKEIVVRGPIFVPMSLVVIIVGLVISGALAFAVVRFNVEAQGKDISRLQDENKEIKTEQQTTRDDITEMKTILTIAFPEEAQAAKRRRK